MTLIRRSSKLILILAATMCIASTGQAARAQDDVVVDENEDAPVNNVVFNGVGVEQVDQILYGRFGGAGVARNKLDSALSLRIDDVDRICGVTEAQKKKLQLAGRGDIKRFFDRVEDTKQRFTSAKDNQVNFNNIWQEIQPLQTELNSGLFGDDSFFTKTVKRTLNDEQSAKFESAVRERHLARYQATVKWCVVQMDRGLGLSDDQRRRLAELLVKETRPPKRFGQNDYWIMLFQASKIPEPQIKAIVDDVQWRILQRQLRQGKAMEQWLKMSGLLDDDKQAGARPAVAAMPALPLVPPTVQIRRADVRKKAVEKKKDDK